MNRLMIASAVAMAATAVSVPAVAGLANNPSFSRQLPIQVPSQAKIVQLDDQGKVINTRRASDDDAAARTVTPTRSPEPEPGDNGGQATEPGDPNGAQDNAPSDAATTAEPSDVHGGTTSGPSDVKGGISGHGG